MKEMNVKPVYIYDADIVVQFLQKKYDDLGRSLDFWHRRTQLWWQNNPYFNNTLPIGWGLWAEDLLVGYLGCIFTSLNYNGKSYTSLNLTCWHVEPEFRANSLDLFLIANAFMPEAMYFNTSPTPQVEKILNAAKYKKYIPQKNDLVCKIMPLHLYLINSASKFRLLINFFRPFLKVVDAALNRYIKRRWNYNDIQISDFSHVNAEELNFFVEKKQSQALTIDRSLKFYKWLLSDEDDKYRILVAKDCQSSQILAIGIYQTYYNKKNRILELTDFCSIDNEVASDKRIIRKMVASIYMKKNVFSNYLAISLTNYSGICLKDCPGRLQFRSRNNKYFKTSNVNLKWLIEKNQYFFTAMGDMYL